MCMHHRARRVKWTGARARATHNGGWATVRGCPPSRSDQPIRLSFAVVSFKRVKGIRYALRNFTALSVREHLRSQIDESGTEAELTPNEVELVRFAADRFDQLKELADRSSAE